MKSKVSKKIFPFAPGIVWELKNGKYIIPNIDKNTWSTALKDRDLVVLCYGGLIESFFSLSVVEALLRLESSKKVFWAGDKRFYDLVKFYGKTEITSCENISHKYPVPLFLDKKNKAYFNVLNNYLTKYSYYGSHPQKNHKPIFEQIFSNSMLPWDNKYYPKISWNFQKLKAWAKTARFYFNKKFIVIIYDESCFSDHKINCLDWNQRNLREFASMMRRFDIEIVLCTNNRASFYDSPYYQAPQELDIVLPLISQASIVLSSNIDFLLISLIISEAAVVAPILLSQKEFDLFENAEFIGAENVIFTTDTMTPHETYVMCEGIL